MKKLLKKGMNRIGFDIVKTNHYVNDTLQYIKYYGSDSVDRRAFYNVSAGGHFGFGGNFSHPCWTNIDVDLGSDIYPRFNPEIDIAHDPFTLVDIPLDSGSAELFQSRFALEHINNEAALKLFQEIYRILKPGGIFKIVVPNFRLDYEAYKREDREYFWWIDLYSLPGMMNDLKLSYSLKQSSLEQVFLVHFAANASEIHSDGSDHRIGDVELQQVMRDLSYEDAMDYCISRCSIEKQKKYRKNHINWWDSNKVKRVLSEAGFNEIVNVSPKQSISPVMRNNPFFDNLWNEVAIYLEAVR